MSLNFECPNCHIELEIPDEYIGREVACSNCNHEFTVPGQEQRSNSVPQLTPAAPQLTPAAPQFTPAAPQFTLAAPQLTPAAPQFTPVPPPEKQFIFICPECGTVSELPESSANTTITCPGCTEAVTATPAVERACPFCGAKVKLQATLCKFCHQQLPPVRPTMRQTMHPAMATNFPGAANLTQSGGNISKSALDKLFTLCFLLGISGWIMVTPGTHVLNETVFSNVGAGVIMTILMIMASVAVIASIVFFFILLYRCWQLIQGRTPVTPGKAIGFLFIPFFGLYWGFVAYWQLGKILDEEEENCTVFQPSRIGLVLAILTCVNCLLASLKLIPWGMQVVFIYFSEAASLAWAAAYLAAAGSFHHAAKKICKY